VHNITICFCLYANCDFVSQPYHSHSMWEDKDGKICSYINSTQFEVQKWFHWLHPDRLTISQICLTTDLWLLPINYTAYSIAIYQPYSIGDQSLACSLFKHTLHLISVPQSAHRTALSHPKYICDCNHTLSLTSMLGQCQLALAESISTGIGGAHGERTVFLVYLHLKQEKWHTRIQPRLFHG